MRRKIFSAIKTLRRNSHFRMFTRTHIHSSSSQTLFSRCDDNIRYIFVIFTLVDLCCDSRRPLIQKIARNLFSSFMRKLQRLFFKVSLCKIQTRFIVTLLSLANSVMYIRFIIIRIPSTIRSWDSRTDSFVNDRFLCRHHETQEFRSRKISLSVFFSSRLHLLY